METRAAPGQTPAGLLTLRRTPPHPGKVTGTLGFVPGVGVCAAGPRMYSTCPVSARTWPPPAGRQSGWRGPGALNALPVSGSLRGEATRRGPTDTPHPRPPENSDVMQMRQTARLAGQREVCPAGCPAEQTGAARLSAEAPLAVIGQGHLRPAGAGQDPERRAQHALPPCPQTPAPAWCPPVPRWPAGQRWLFLVAFLFFNQPAAGKAGRLRALSWPRSAARRPHLSPRRSTAGSEARARRAQGRGQKCPPAHLPGGGRTHSLLTGGGHRLLRYALANETFFSKLLRFF